VEESIFPPLWCFTCECSNFLLRKCIIKFKLHNNEKSEQRVCLWTVERPNKIITEKLCRQTYWHRSISPQDFCHGQKRKRKISVHI
jgi:hypothetical protein